MSDFALTMDYAGHEVSEVQYRHDRAKYYNEVPGRDEFLRFCESLLEQEDMSDQKAQDMVEKAESAEVLRQETALEDLERENEKLEGRLSDARDVLQECEDYLTQIEPRNERETQLLAKVQIEVFGEKIS